jgi:Na+/H+-dicarboxylate symporter/ABC-type amino acid transport substrate-binding protein
MTRGPARRLGIATQVFIGLGLGILVGVFFGEEVAFLKIAGDAFIALLQITVIPYIVVALITSLGRQTFDDLRALVLGAGSVLLVLWAVGLAVVLASPLALPNWLSASFFSVSEIEPGAPVDFLSLYIPSNIFYALSNAVVPAIVVFSILFGVALINVTQKQRLLDLLSIVGDALLTITGYIGKLAPYGVFAITANAAGTIEVADLGRLQVYIVIYVTLALILSLWFVPCLIAAVTPLSHRSILRTFRGPLITAFATGNVLVVLPVLAADGKRLVDETDPRKGSDEQAESSIDILVAAAYPFPTMGGLLALVFVLFGGWYVGSMVPLDQYPMLAIAGLASLFGGTVLALPFLFDLLRLPADLFPVFVTVDVIGSRFGTLLAAMNIIAIALIGTFALEGRVTLRAAPLLRLAAITIVLLATALFGIRAFYTHVYVDAYAKDQILAGLQLIQDPQPHIVYREPPKEILTESARPIGLDRLKENGVLRVCYSPGDYPSAFFNASGNLVGFDIEMAHRFAQHLNVNLEFLPTPSMAEAETYLNTSYCNVLMSLIAISPGRTERFFMTDPVFNEPVGLIVRDHRRRAFRSWSDIRAMHGLRIALIEDRTSLVYLETALPNAMPVPVSTKADIDRLLAAGAPNVDAIAMFAEEAAAWTVRYPQFSFVAPSPTIFIPSGYAVARGDTDMLLYLDTWLLNAKVDGTVDELYRYWMLGQVEQAQPPRWSIIRNVLGWIDRA